MSTWHLIRLRDYSSAFEATGRTCKATSWHAAVWELLFDELVGNRQAIENLDLLGEGIAFRLSGHAYRVIRNVDLDDDAIETLRARLAVDAAELQAEAEQEWDQ